MPVPEEIRKVPRPVNTVVYDNGGNGPERYAVRARAGSVYVPGKQNTSPINGKTIGHIYNGKFVPKQKKPVMECPNMLSYGASAFVHSVSDGLFDELIEAGFALDDACKIMTIASLRAIECGITDCRLSTKYKLDWISKYYPGMGISRNTVKKLEEEIGMHGEKREKFFCNRAAAVLIEHHVIIDGMLVEDNSRANSLSGTSFKSKIKGCKQISIIYAYDLETMELICAEVYPGNIPDANAYADFLRHNHIDKGIIVADKGFPPNRIKQRLNDCHDLHYLAPMKSNDKRITEYKLTEYDGVLSDIGDDQVTYAKREGKNSIFYYSFQSKKISDERNESYLKKMSLNGEFNNTEYEEFKKKSGVIVFESDQNLNPLDVYLTYADRWLLERVFDCYKNDTLFDCTRVQNDFSVIGDDFIKFITTELTNRMLKKARDAGLLSKMTYGDLLDDLRNAWRLAEAPENPASDDGYWIHTTSYMFEEMEALGLSIPAPKSEPQKRGRPRKNPVEDVSTPKRKRGRPRKDEGTAQA